MAYIRNSLTTYALLEKNICKGPLELTIKKRTISCTKLKKKYQFSLKPTEFFFFFVLINQQSLLPSTFFESDTWYLRLRSRWFWVCDFLFLNIISLIKMKLNWFLLDQLLLDWNTYMFSLTNFISEIFNLLESVLEFSH